MIKFFRNIRKQLLGEGKTGKYFKYAIGEILLVVIGILIALQINNWNEQQKDNKLEQEYYCRLMEDVILDEEKINTLLAASQERLKAANQAARLLQQEQAKKIETANFLSVAIRAIYADFKPNDAAFVDLKSGANLNIIKDKPVISALNNYFNKVEGYISIVKVNGENAVKIFYSYDDVFANGWAQASLQSGWVAEGVEPDVRAAIELNENEVFDAAMQYRLYNDALQFISHNQRQIILYKYIKDEIATLKGVLETKCSATN